MTESQSVDKRTNYQIFMLVLCLYALLVLAVRKIVDLSESSRTVLEYADYFVCGVFLIDFALSLLRASNRWTYFATWGWIDLLSSIPALDVTRWGRIGRILRVLRVLRGLRATKVIATMVVRKRAESTFLAASLVAILLITFCSVSVLHFETEPDSNIRTADDAIWWSLTTITTVGYGDRYPVTIEGRIVAVILMAAGVGLFGIFSGFLAAWFVGSSNDVSKDMDELRAEIVALRRALEATRRLGGLNEQTS